MGSIKAVVSEPIEGKEEYHMMVSIYAYYLYRIFVAFYCCQMVWFG